MTLHRFTLDDGYVWIDSESLVSASGRTRITAYLRFARRLFAYLYREQRAADRAKWRAAIREDTDR